MKKTSDAQKRASAKYDKENTVIKSVKFNMNTDKDLLDHIAGITNFQQYIKSLIKKDMEDKKMKEFKMEDLQAWNEEQEREDTMYVVEHYFYEKGSNGNLIEKDGDYYFKGSNDYEEARKMFDECIQYFSNQFVVIMLTKASSVYAGNLEYDMIDSYSTLKKR